MSGLRCPVSVRLSVVGRGFWSVRRSWLVFAFGSSRGEFVARSRFRKMLIGNKRTRELIVTGEASARVIVLQSLPSLDAADVKMDTLGIEPRAFRMQSGCDTTTPCAQ